MFRHSHSDIQLADGSSTYATNTEGRKQPQPTKKERRQNHQGTRVSERGNEIDKKDENRPWTLSPSAPTKRLGIRREVNLLRHYLEIPFRPRFYDHLIPHSSLTPT
ncbi:hypothetical protein GJ744_005641 [Endocarpon pusillum]|uniref:Uncharacterized protein n=1 Tax=Endocarpon pusillum TaxID=364733 RepID=A0A8H7AC41_9EURO|nr:hypothetical protein GJ744_005641 [Endocarpon pusillum]